MKKLVFKSWLLLLYVDMVMRFGKFQTIHRLVRAQVVRPIRPSAQRASEDICNAVDLACVFYLKPVLCLQRSAATTLLLRQNGWRAEMTIGVQMLPFQSHAWVEIQGKIVNDKPYLLDSYRVLARC